jgi:hypothetical protein
MSAHDAELELQHINERLGELLDEVASLLIWTLEFAKANHLQRDEALGHHIKRIRSILAEIGNLPELESLMSSTERKPPDKLPVYPIGGVPPSSHEAALKQRLAAEPRDS